MKKLMAIVLGTSMALAGTQHVFSMQRLFAALGLGGGKVEAEEVDASFLENWDTLLKKQDYDALSRELYASLDDLSAANSTKRFQANRWMSEKLTAGLDPFLLYMDARTAFGTSPVHHLAYAPAFENLMLCIVLTEVAQGVATSFGYESSPGKGIPDLASALKAKFRALHGNGTLNPGIRSEVVFASVQEQALAKLQALVESDEAVEALPLFHWVLRTTVGHFFGWGITWCTLTEAELAARSSKAFVAALIAATKTILAEQIAILTKVEDWDKFLGFEAVDGKASSSHDDGGKSGDEEEEE